MTAWRSTLALLALGFWLSVLGAKLLEVLVWLLGDPSSMNPRWFA